MHQASRSVIPSERSESRELRTFVTAEQTFGAKILRRASLAQDDMTDRCCIFYTALSHNCPAGRCVAQRIKIEMIAGGTHTIMQYAARPTVWERYLSAVTNRAVPRRSNDYCPAGHALTVGPCRPNDNSPGRQALLFGIRTHLPAFLSYAPGSGRRPGRWLRTGQFPVR